eukprot:g14272.t1
MGALSLHKQLWKMLLAFWWSKEFWDVLWQQMQTIPDALCNAAKWVMKKVTQTPAFLLKTAREAAEYARKMAAAMKAKSQNNLARFFGRPRAPEAVPKKEREAVEKAEKAVRDAEKNVPNGSDKVGSEDEERKLLEEVVLQHLENEPVQEVWVSHSALQVSGTEEQSDTEEKLLGELARAEEAERHATRQLELLSAYGPPPKTQREAARLLERVRSAEQAARSGTGNEARASFSQLGFAFHDFSDEELDLYDEVDFGFLDARWGGEGKEEEEAGQIGGEIDGGPDSMRGFMQREERSFGAAGSSGDRDPSNGDGGGELQFAEPLQGGPQREMPLHEAVEMLHDTYGKRLTQEELARFGYPSTHPPDAKRGLASTGPKSSHSGSFLEHVASNHTTTWGAFLERVEFHEEQAVTAETDPDREAKREADLAEEEEYQQATAKEDAETPAAEAIPPFDEKEQAEKSQKWVDQSTRLSNLFTRAFSKHMLQAPGVVLAPPMMKRIAILSLDMVAALYSILRDRRKGDI